MLVALGFDPAGQAFAVQRFAGLRFAAGVQIGGQGDDGDQGDAVAINAILALLGYDCIDGHLRSPAAFA